MNNEEKNFETLKAEIEKLKKDVYERSIEGVNRSIKQINIITAIIGIFVVILGAYTFIETNKAKSELREDVRDMKETIRYETERAQGEVEKIKDKVKKEKEGLMQSLKEETKKAEELREEIEAERSSVERTVMEIEGKRKEMVELVDNARFLADETGQKHKAAEEAARVSQASRYFAEGLMLLRVRMYDEAIDKYKLAIELDQEFAAAYHYWGIALYGLWELKKENAYLEEALLRLDESIEIEKNDAWTWYDKASIHTLLTEKEEALESLQKAFEFNPKYKEAAKKDEDFEWLWKDEKFKKLVE